MDVYWTAMSSVCRDVHFVTGEPLEDWGPENKYSQNDGLCRRRFFLISRAWEGCWYDTLRVVRHLPGVGLLPSIFVLALKLYWCSM